MNKAVVTSYQPPEYSFISAPEWTGEEAWLNAPIERLTMDDLPVDNSKAIVVLALRSMDYGDYLRTEHWRGIRLRTMRKSLFQCVACSKDATEAHHLNYARKGFEHPQDVIAACRACHQIWHDTWRIQLRESLK